MLFRSKGACRVLRRSARGSRRELYQGSLEMIQACGLSKRCTGPSWPIQKKDSCGSAKLGSGHEPENESRRKLQGILKLTYCLQLNPAR